MKKTELLRLITLMKSIRNDVNLILGHKNNYKKEYERLIN